TTARPCRPTSRRSRYAGSWGIDPTRPRLLSTWATPRWRSRTPTPRWRRGRPRWRSASRSTIRTSRPSGPGSKASDRWRQHATEVTLREALLPTEADMISWAQISYGAVLSGLLAAVLVGLVAGTGRWPAVVAGAAATVAGAVAWNAILRAAHGDQ